MYNSSKKGDDDDQSNDLCWNNHPLTEVAIDGVATMNSDFVPTWWHWIFSCPSKFAQLGEGEWGKYNTGGEGCP